MLILGRKKLRQHTKNAPKRVSSSTLLGAYPKTIQPFKSESTAAHCTTGRSSSSEGFSSSPGVSSVGVSSSPPGVSGSSVSGCMYDIVSKIENELGAKVNVKKELALIAIVGRNMAGKSGICARIFASLSAVGINIKMIAQPPDETNIIVGVDNSNYKKAIQALYKDFEDAKNLSEKILQRR